jgi:hypothetical protein
VKTPIVGLISSALLLSSNADAFTVRSADDGSPVRWEPTEVAVILDPNLAEVSDDVSAALEEAFAAWTEASDLALPVVSLNEGPVDEIGYRDGQPNWSTVRYAAEGSPLAGKALAITVLTFDDEGRILDADILVNGGADRPFQMIGDEEKHKHGKHGAKGAHGAKGQQGEEHDDVGHAYDVQNVLTHEVGHFLGLGEEEVDVDATMFVTSAKGEIKKRDLSDDDLAGLETLYLDVEEASMACSTGPLGRSTRWAWLAGLVALTGLWSTRRRLGKRVLPALLAIALCSLPMASLEVKDERGASSLSPAAEGWATVVATEAVWDGGLIATRLTLEMAASAAPSHLEVWVWGGTADGLTQVVGHAPAPRVGDRIPVARSAGGRGAAFATFSRS